MTSEWKHAYTTSSNVYLFEDTCVHRSSGFLALGVTGYASEASSLYHKAQKLEKAGNVMQAYVFLYPSLPAGTGENKLFAAKAAALQADALLLGKRRSKPQR